MTVIPSQPTPRATTASERSTGRVYRVVTGDTMTSVADRHRLALQSVIDANPEVRDPNLIRPGQELRLPAPAPEVAPPAPAPAPAMPRRASGERPRPASDVDGGTVRAMLEARAAETTLARGSTGAPTEELQKLLNKTGHDAGAIDGIFGARTETALKSFQRAHQLAPDGRASLGTMKKLREIAGAPALERGSSGAATKELQTLLNQAGHDAGAVDGEFGARTERALRSFQRAHHLADTARAGAGTMAKLREVAGTPQTVLARGARGEATKELQTLLNRTGHDAGAVDGEFGPRTESALRSFQRAHHLAANGQAGAGTLNKLREVARELGDARLVTGWRDGVSFPLTVLPIGRGFELSAAAARDFRRMEAAARADGVTFKINSAFRTHEQQRELYRSMPPGMASAPGYSNHQQGRSVDIDVVSDWPLRWLRGNAGRFNFVNDVWNEPWHWTHTG